MVLSYHDTIIYESDVELLEGPHWLNDTIIGFYLEYLEEEVYGKTMFCFIRPEVTQCLKLSPLSEFPVFLDPLQFKDKNVAVMPLNDCENPNTPGGSHWSLLVFCKTVRTFYHIDSSKGSNYSPAKLLSAKLSEYLELNGDYEFKTLNSLQQTNSYDCGVFVLCNLDNVLQHLFRHNTLDTLDTIREYQVARKRNDIKQLIINLARHKL